MSKPCSICTHDEREKIDLLLALGVTCRGVAKQYPQAELSLKQLGNHKRRHLAAPLAQAEETATVAGPPELLAQARALHLLVLQTVTRAEKAGDVRAVLAALREARSNLELLARLLGQSDERPQIPLLEHPEWARMRDALFEALGPYPQVRVAVADRLEALDEGD